MREPHDHPACRGQRGIAPEVAFSLHPGPVEGRAVQFHSDSLRLEPQVESIGATTRHDRKLTNSVAELAPPEHPRVTPDLELALTTRVEQQRKLHQLPSPGQPAQRLEHPHQLARTDQALARCRDDRCSLVATGEKRPRGRQCMRERDGRYARDERNRREPGDPVDDKVGPMSWHPRVAHRDVDGSSPRVEQSSSPEGGHVAESATTDVCDLGALDDCRELGVPRPAIRRRRYRHQLAALHKVVEVMAGDRSAPQQLGTGGYASASNEEGVDRLLGPQVHPRSVATRAEARWTSRGPVGAAESSTANDGTLCGSRRGVSCR